MKNVRKFLSSKIVNNPDFSLFSIFHSYIVLSGDATIHNQTDYRFILAIHMAYLYVNLVKRLFFKRINFIGRLLSLFKIVRKYHKVRVSELQKSNIEGP